MGVEQGEWMGLSNLNPCCRKLPGGRECSGGAGVLLGVSEANISGFGRGAAQIMGLEQGGLMGGGRKLSGGREWGRGTDVPLGVFEWGLNRANGWDFQI